MVWKVSGSEEKLEGDRMIRSKCFVYMQDILKE